MDGVPTSTKLSSLSSSLLLLVLNLHRALDSPHSVDEFEERDEIFDPLCLALPTLTFDPQIVYNATLHSFRFCSLLTFFDDEVGFWVKPRSITWFSRFLMDQFDDERWIQMFLMSKVVVHALAELLRPLIQKLNTKYRLAIPVLIRVACSLIKLAQGTTLLICSELFVVGQIVVSLMSREVVQETNICLRSKISWPTSDRLRECQSSFQRLCGLPGVVGAIDRTHVSISKPKIGPTDYYYFKTGGYSINCQALVFYHKKFLDLFIGMPGSTNDSRMLRRSSLYEQSQHGNLFDSRHSVAGFSPYLLGDLGYPLLPWLMTPHPMRESLPIAETLFNRHLCRGHGVVENAFGILKQTFHALLTKSDLYVAFVSDMITCYCLLHNTLLGQSHEDVERLLQVVQREGYEGDFPSEDGIFVEQRDGGDNL